MKSAILVAAVALMLAACGPSPDETARAPEDSVPTANAAPDPYRGASPQGAAVDSSGRASAATGASEPASNDAAGGDASGSTNTQ